jgi:7-cyano-7-deazaguanine tRNA-ribosyltransferase
MEKTLFNAYEYFNLFSSNITNKKVSLMGVIQGYDRSSIEYAAQELLKIGYTNFGIGSLLGKNYSTQVEMIRFASNIVGSSNLHVFGVTGLQQIKAMVDIGVKSFDSTRPTMAAAFFQVFYSRPFQTYVIGKSRVKKTALRLSKPLSCECPICKQNPNDLFIPSPRHYMRLRSIHNYYHLMVSIFDILKKKKGSDANALSNVLWPGN